MLDLTIKLIIKHILGVLNTFFLLRLFCLHVFCAKICVFSLCLFREEDAGHITNTRRIASEDFLSILLEAAFFLNRIRTDKFAFYFCFRSMTVSDANISMPSAPPLMK